MTEVFELTYHGGGGFGYFEVWNMPVPHRRFNLKKITEYLKKVQEMRDKERQVVTENTDMSKFKVSQDVIDASKQFDFVAKAKPKK